VADSGEVARQTVIDVLTANGVQIAPMGGCANTFALRKGDRVESQQFHDHVSKRMLQYLKRNYSVPIHLFYNPNTIEMPVAVEVKRNIR
jgi:hypothetical protein